MLTLRTNNQRAINKKEKITKYSYIQIESV